MGHGWGRRTRFVPLVVGWIVIVVAVDLVAGAALDVASSDDDRSEGRIETGNQGAEVPALMQDLPWAADYVDEVTSLPYEYEPYLLGGLRPTDGPLITVDGGVRRTEPSPLLGAEAVEVWFFGGSTMFGLGQRDPYTIPSIVTRLAAEDGIAIRAVNFGRPSFVAWQELLLFEDQLARRPPPDLAIFYDGANDFFYQQAHPSPDPVHDTVDDLADRLDGAGLPVPQPPERESDSLWDEYSTRSAVARFGHAAFGTMAPAAADEPGQPPTDPVEAARHVYLRALGLEQRLADRGGVAPFFFWQPVQGDHAVPYRKVADELPDPVIDLSAILDDVAEEVFVDDVHTLEAGAQQVAEAIYVHLRPTLVEAARR